MIASDCNARNTTLQAVNGCCCCFLVVFGFETTSRPQTLTHFLSKDTRTAAVRGQKTICFGDFDSFVQAWPLFQVSNVATLDDICSRTSANFVCFH